MKMSLRTKLTISYISITIICVLLISILANFFLKENFKKYIINNQEQKNKEIVNLVNQQYAQSEAWRADIIEHIGSSALEQGMIINVRNVFGQSIWDARVYNNGRCGMIISHIAENMLKQYPDWKGEYVQIRYPVTFNSREVGTVEIGYYGPFYYTDNDILFINTLNKLIMGAAVISLICALMLGTFMAKRLSMPISRVISTAQMISMGHFGSRSDEKSDIKEINQLTNTINELGETLGGQEKLRKRLTRDVAHELRTPVATLQSHMEAMIDGIWEPDTERLQSCHEEILRIGRMIGDIEQISMYESENLILHKTEFDLSELVNNIILNFQTDYRKKGVKISFEGSRETITADKDKISQVIVNLLSNALKYTKEGGEVLIGVRRCGNMAEIYVRDNGIGISDEDLPLIFERFYRADKSRNRLTGGSGLGLTIAKAIVDAHKGAISVKSSLGAGTEFSVLLPKHM